MAEAYKAGRISLKDVGRVMQELAESPLFVTAMVEAVEAQISGKGQTRASQESIRGLKRRISLLFVDEF